MSVCKYVGGYEFRYVRSSGGNYYWCIIEGNRYKFRYNSDLRVWRCYFYNNLIEDPNLINKNKLVVFNNIVRQQHGVNVGHPSIPPTRAVVETGFRGADWYYEGELLFECCKGNKGTFYLGEVKGVEVKVKYHRSHCVWLCIVNGKNIKVDRNKERVFDYLVHSWDGVIR